MQIDSIAGNVRIQALLEISHIHFELIQSYDHIVGRQSGRLRCAAIEDMREPYADRVIRHSGTDCDGRTGRAFRLDFATAIGP